MSEKGGARPESPHLSHTEIAHLWGKFRQGEVAGCPRDAAAMALAVDGAAKAYRLTCTKCGLASPWFSASPSGLFFRSPMPTLGPEEPLPAGD